MQYQKQPTKFASTNLKRKEKHFLQATLSWESKTNKQAASTQMRWFKLV